MSTFDIYSAASQAARFHALSLAVTHIEDLVSTFTSTDETLIRPFLDQAAAIGRSSLRVLAEPARLPQAKEFDLRNYTLTRIQEISDASQSKNPDLYRRVLDKIYGEAPPDIYIGFFNAAHKFGLRHAVEDLIRDGYVPELMIKHHALWSRKAPPTDFVNVIRHVAYQSIPQDVGVPHVRLMLSGLYVGTRQPNLIKMASEPYQSTKADMRPLWRLELLFLSEEFRRKVLAGAQARTENPQVKQEIATYLEQRKTMHAAAYRGLTRAKLAPIFDFIGEHDLVDAFKQLVLEEGSLVPRDVARAFEKWDAEKSQMQLELEPRIKVISVANPVPMGEHEYNKDSERPQIPGVHNTSDGRARSKIVVGRYAALYRALENNPKIERLRVYSDPACLTEEGNGIHSIFDITAASGLRTQIVFNQRKGDGTYIIKRPQDLIDPETILSADEGKKTTMHVLLDMPWVQLRKFYAEDEWVGELLALIEADPETIQPQTKRIPHWKYEGPQLLNSVRAFKNAVGRAPGADDGFIEHGSEEPGTSLYLRRSWNNAAKAVKKHLIRGLEDCNTLTDVASLPEDFTL